MGLYESSQPSSGLTTTLPYMPDVQGFSAKALELAEAGHYEQALDLVSREIKADANNANAWYNKGIILFKMGRFQDARNSFAQATDIDPAFAEAWYNKGIALMNLEKYLEAIRAFDKAIAVNSNDPDARHQRDLAQKKIMESCGGKNPVGTSQTRLFR